MGLLRGYLNEEDSRSVYAHLRTDRVQRQDKGFLVSRASEVV